MRLASKLGGMWKSITIAVLALLMGGCWFFFIQSGKQIVDLEKQVSELAEQGDREEKTPAIKVEIQGLEGQRVFNGILLVFLSMAVIGILFATLILPLLADKMSQAVYGGNEEIEDDPMRDARVLMAQGKWTEAIEAFHIAARSQELDQMPFIEIAKIQKNHLEDPAAAIETLRQAIQNHEWPQESLVFLMFQLAEIYDEALDDRAAAVIILEQVAEQFPETRHSAIANSKLRSWGME